MHRERRPMAYLRVFLPVLACLASGVAAFTADELPHRLQEPTSFTFWEVGLSNVEVERPTLVALPTPTGQQLQFWVWRFRFKPTTTLHMVKRYLKEMETKASPVEIQGPKTSPKDFYKRHLERIEETLKDELLSQAYVAIHASTGEVVPDTSNPAVRNYFEKRAGVRMYTVAEIRSTPLRKLEVNRHSKMVEAVAIFPRLDPFVSLFEIRLQGLGRRVVPRYAPGKLLFLERPHDAALRRAYRFTYRRLGATGEDHLDKINMEKKQADWVWIWPAHIQAGRFRKIEVTRASGLKREYRYIPYWVWNNTYYPQDLRVLRAGMTFANKESYPDSYKGQTYPLKWRGHELSFHMTDIGNPDDFWKTQVDRIITKRVNDGTEKQFVEQYEEPALGADRPEAQEDIQRKAAVLHANGRHVRKVLDPQEIAQGIMVIRWGVEDLPKLVDNMVRDLRITAMVGTDNPSDLFKAYDGIREKAPDGTPTWKRPAEPDKEKVVELLVKLAGEDLQSRGAEVTEDDKRRYGDLAPIGRLVNLIASDWADKRAEQGLVDVFFEVTWDQVYDRATFPSQFRRMLPPERKPFEEPDIATDFSSVVTTTTTPPPAPTPAAGGAGDDDDDDEDEDKDEKAGDDDDDAAGGGGDIELPW